MFPKTHISAWYYLPKYYMKKRVDPLDYYILSLTSIITMCFYNREVRHVKNVALSDVFKKGRRYLKRFYFHCFTLVV